MAKMKQFEDYRVEVQEYMSGVVIALKKRGNYDPKVWYFPMQKLAYNIELWFNCKDAIREYGLTMNGGRGLTTRPEVILLNSVQIRIENDLANFGLTPKALKNITVDEDNTDDFLETLIN